MSTRLDRAIHGRGAFRFFKDTIHDLGLQDAWYAVRDQRFRDIAAEWCREDGIGCDPA